MKPSIIIDMIAQFIAKRILPEGSPVFSRMTDMELLSIVSWAERWDGKRVYDTAFSQVFPKKQIKDAKPIYDMWVTAENPKLPMIVREELIRAFRINIVTGRMDVLRLGAWAQTQCVRIMWIGLFLIPIILYLL
jgi:hypothetical protein